MTKKSIFRVDFYDVVKAWAEIELTPKQVEVLEVFSERLMHDAYRAGAGLVLAAANDAREEEA